GYLKSANVPCCKAPDQTFLRPFNDRVLFVVNMPFGLGNTSSSSGLSGGGVNNEKLEAAVVDSCASKCLNQRYSEADLTKGEAVCIDRCVGKFIEANKIIGEKLRESGGEDSEHETHLDETDGSALFTEALTAEVKSVLANQTSLVGAVAA
ncbi:6495_t:CDS:2, partial [Acaulospora colombiana]